MKKNKTYESFTKERSTSFFREQNKLEHSQLKFMLGCVLISLGILATSSGGSWDISNHLLNKPETFFSIPHLVLYSGIGVAVTGFSFMFTGNRNLSHHLKFNTATKLVLIGIPTVILAGPFDYSWHVAFGFDGLLSPSHFILTVGLFLTSLGALLGIIQIKNRFNGLNDGNSLEKKTSIRNSNHNPIFDSNIFYLIGLLPVWLMATGLLYMLSLPFSNTEFFNFNPDPTYAAIFATISYPFLISTILYLSFGLGRKFGMLSITGASFLFINMLTSIIPNEFLIVTIPFYLLSLIPFVVADLIFSFTKQKTLHLLGGAIIGTSSFMVYFPLITYVYNGVFTKTAVFPSFIPNVYSELLVSAYPILAGGFIASGMLGIIFGQHLISRIEKYSKKSINNQQKKTI